MKVDESQLKNWKKMNTGERCLYANDLIEVLGGSIASILVAVHSRCREQGFSLEHALVEVAKDCLQCAEDAVATRTNGVLCRNYSISAMTSYFYDNKEQVGPPKSKKWRKYIDDAGDLDLPEYVNH